jgi:hypothetical protein
VTIGQRVAIGSKNLIAHQRSSGDSPKGSRLPCSDLIVASKVIPAGRLERRTTRRVDVLSDPAACQRFAGESPKGSRRPCSNSTAEEG